MVIALEAHVAAPDYKLAPETKKSWVEALLSDKFKQGNGSLRFKDNYCCLGVLCEVTKLGKWTCAPSVDDDEPDEWYYRYHDNGHDVRDKALLPDALGNLLFGDLTNSADPLVPIERRDWEACQVKNKHAVSLSVLNDAGLTFPQIADVINYFL